MVVVLMIPRKLRDVSLRQQDRASTFPPPPKQVSSYQKQLRTNNRVLLDSRLPKLDDQPFNYGTLEHPREQGGIHPIHLELVFPPTIKSIHRSFAKVWMRKREHLNLVLHLPFELQQEINLEVIGGRVLHIEPAPAAWPYSVSLPRETSFFLPISDISRSFIFPSENHGSSIGHHDAFDPSTHHTKPITVFEHLPTCKQTYTEASAFLDAKNVFDINTFTIHIAAMLCFYYYVAYLLA